jgi:TP901 family phage tail tape measure protein
MQDMTARLVEIDTLMVDLQRVMDAPDYKFVEMLDQAVVASDQLSSKLTDFLKILGDFGRMGFDENQLMDISKTGQILQNISDLDAKDSVDTLTSAMLNFNIAAEDSITIADKLNEIDNNFAVSTKDLSDGLRKSASTAKTFGVEIDTLLGYIAAIGSTTRESGAIIGNGLKTIMSRITTMSDAETALNGVNISIKDMAGNVRPVSDILSQLAGQWGNLSDEQRQNLGVTLAGRYQLSRFLALMNNFSISQEATESSLNSTNSSMEEQAKFADSLQGRINRLDTAWNKLTLSTGDAFLTDGLISAVEILGDIANISSAVIDKVGVLSGVFGTAGIAVFAFSANLRTLTTAALFGTQAVSQQALATAGLTASMRTGTIATIGLTGALRGLLSASIIGGIFVALGFAIEKLISAYANAKREQEEFEESQQKNVEALTKNKEKTEELIEQYNKLSEQKKNGAWDTENEKEYLRIQSEIANVYPALIDHIDSTGQAHIRTSEEIQKEIDLTNKLIEAKKEELKVKAQDEIQKEIDKQKELREELENLKKQRDSFKDYKGSAGANDQELEKRIKSVETQMVSTEIKISGASQKINDQILKVSDAYNKLEVNPAIQKSVDSLVSSMDFSDMDASEIEGVSIRVAELTDNLQKAYDSGDDNSYEKALNEFNAFMQSVGATDVSLGELDLAYDSVKKKTDAVASATYGGSEAMDGMSESIDGVSDSADDLLKSYEDAVDNISELNGIINELNDEDGYGLSAESMGLLMEKYPELLGYIGNESALREQIINKIDEEKNVALDAMTAKLDGNEQYFKEVLGGNETLVSNLAKAYNIDLKNTKTMAQLKAQINSKLMQKLGSDWADYYDAQTMAFTEAGRKMLETMSYQEAINSPQLRAIGDYQVQMRQLSESLRNVTDNFTGGTIALEGLTNETSKSKKETESSTYISDKFAKALEAINLEIEKQNKLQSTYTSDSKQYQSAIKKEIKLLEQKKNLLNEQSKTLQQQIKAGKIAPTGIVTTSSSPVSTSSYSQVSGGSTAAQIWNFFKSKGFSDSIAAGIMGNLQLESGLNPNARNPSSGAFGIAQWLGGRKTGLANYAASVGTSMNNLSTQLNFLWKELNSTESRTMRYLSGNQGASASTIAAMFDKLFERSEGTHIPQRQAYANQFMSQFNGTGGGSSVIASSGEVSKDIANNMQAVDQARSTLNSLRGDILSIEEEIAGLQKAYVESIMSVYERRISELDYALARTDNHLASLDSATSTYREVMSGKKETLYDRQRENASEIAYLNSIIQKGGLAQNVLFEFKEKLKELNLERQEMFQQQRDLSGLIADSYIEELNLKLDELNHTIEMSNMEMENFKQGTDGFNKAQESQLKAIAEKIYLYKVYSKQLEHTLETEKMTTDKQKEINAQIRQFASEIRNLESEIFNMRSQYADETINALRQSYEKRRDIEVKAKDKQIEDLEEVHDKRMEQYDEDLERFEEIINEKMRLLDEQADEEDWNKEISKMQQEERDLKSQISALSLSSSMSDQAKRLELEEQLTELQEQIEERRSDRERELRKKSLQEQLDAFKEEIDEKKESEQNQFELSKSRLEQERKEIEWHYQELLNNEIRFGQMREDIIKGNTRAISLELEGFLKFFQLQNQGVIEGLGESWTALLVMIQEVMKATGNLENMPSIPAIPGMGGSGEGSKGRLKTGTFRNKEDAQRILSFLRDIYHASNARIVEENGYFRAIADFDSLERAQRVLDDMKKKGHIGVGYVEKFHQGGIVGGKGSKLANLFNNLFNSKPNEQVIKSLKGELQVPPQNFMNGIQNLKNLITPNLQPAMGGNIYNLNPTLNITVQGGKQTGKEIGKQAMDHMNTILRDLGKK